MLSSKFLKARCVTRVCKLGHEWYRMPDNLIGCSSEYCFLTNHNHVIHATEVPHIEMYSLSTIVYGVVFGGVSAALMTSWLANASCAQSCFQP